MEIFSEFSGSTIQKDGNYNEFVSQYILLKLNGSESIHDCLYRVISNYALPDEALTAGKSLYNELGIDELDFREIMIALKEVLIFKSKDNSFYRWYKENWDNNNVLMNTLSTITIGQLEALIYSGDPLYAAKVR